MNRFTSLLSATATIVLSMAAAAMPAQARVETGLLTCEVGGGFALILSSPRELHCVFHNRNGQTEAYGGKLEEIGLDIGISGHGVISWAVSADTTELPPGELAGSYSGAEAGAAVAVGGSGRLLVGGSRRTISLQPLSVEARSGLNIAIGVASMRLYPLFRVSQRQAYAPTPAVGLPHDLVPHVHKTPHYACGSYTHLQEGQTLSGVAHACGVSLVALLDANPDIANVRDISTGKLIHIPSHVGHARHSPCGDRGILEEG
ncbi:MAG: DUF992 domain-containing protein [Caldilineaceae bacterium]|nr:DUF992 domain-containing protein [Caldilineaceae bacterium]